MDLNQNISQMINDKKLEEWREQHKKDMQQFRKDEIKLQEMEKDEDRTARSFFQRMRSKYLNFHTEEHQKLNRLLYYSDIYSQLQKYPKIMSAYMTYHTSSILLLGLCVFAPKKWASKLILSLSVYGLKVNITDGLFTYYMIEKMAVGGTMSPKEQELRNSLEFYYLRNMFRNKPMTEEEKKQSEQILEKIKIQNEKYNTYKHVSNLL